MTRRRRVIDSLLVNSIPNVAQHASDLHACTWFPMTFLPPNSREPHEGELLSRENDQRLPEDAVCAAVSLANSTLDSLKEQAKDTLPSSATNSPIPAPLHLLAIAAYRLSAPPGPHLIVPICYKIQKDGIDQSILEELQAALASLTRTLKAGSGLARCLIRGLPGYVETVNYVQDLLVRCQDEEFRIKGFKELVESAKQQEKSDLGWTESISKRIALMGIPTTSVGAETKGKQGTSARRGKGRDRRGQGRSSDRPHVRSNNIGDPTSPPKLDLDREYYSYVSNWIPWTRFGTAVPGLEGGLLRITVFKRGANRKPRCSSMRPASPFTFSCSNHLSQRILLRMRHGIARGLEGLVVSVRARIPSRMCCSVNGQIG